MGSRNDEESFCQKPDTAFGPKILGREMPATRRTNSTGSVEIVGENVKGWLLQKKHCVTPKEGVTGSRPMIYSSNFLSLSR